MFFSDYHTHTVYSHARGSIAENVQAAIQKGLKEIAITDHGTFHKSYGIRQMDLSDYIAQIEKANNENPQIRVLRGVECNILNSKGDIDIFESDYEWLDVLVCGHHKYVKGAGVRETFKFNFPVFWANLWGKSSSARIVANTDAFIRMMERYPVDIISHPNLGIRVDLKELGRASAHFGTYLEINGKGVRYSAKEANLALEQGAKFIADSDAHSPNRVGDFSKVISFINEAQIPLESIVNYNKLPTFKPKKQSK